MALAGAYDGYNSVQRTGAVIRTRRPSEVSPLPRRLQRLLERDRYRVYMAVDDASSDTVVAWKTANDTQSHRERVRRSPPAPCSATFAVRPRSATSSSSSAIGVPADLVDEFVPAGPRQVVAHVGEHQQP
jgi:hypothetical protein